MRALRAAPAAWLNRALAAGILVFLVLVPPLHVVSAFNLSQIGCFMLSGGKVQPKELIRVEIMFPDDAPIYLWAEVVEKAEEIGFAMKFTSVDEADQTRLGQFVQRCLASRK